MVYDDSDMPSIPEEYTWPYVTIDDGERKVTTYDTHLQVEAWSMMDCIWKSSKGSYCKPYSEMCIHFIVFFLHSIKQGSNIFPKVKLRGNYVC